MFIHLCTAIYHQKSASIRTPKGQEHEERVREQEAKAKEEKIYQHLSNQQVKKAHKSNVSQETK